MIGTRVAVGRRPAGGGGGRGRGGSRGDRGGSGPAARPPLRLVVIAAGGRPGSDDGGRGHNSGSGARTPLRIATTATAAGSTPTSDKGGAGNGRDNRGGGPRRGGRGSGAKPAPPLRLTRRGRIVVVTLAVMGMCTAFSVGRVTSSASTIDPGDHMRVHVVEPGETLWGIARDLSPESDTRAVVAWLADVNGLASVGLVPGQVLRLPYTVLRLPYTACSQRDTTCSHRDAGAS